MEARIIKRYQNRKLYDTFQSCYVTLEEIAQIMREGDNVQVIDNRSKSDITSHVYLQIIVNQERKVVERYQEEDVELLKDIIKSDQAVLTSYIKNLKNQI